VSPIYRIDNRLVHGQIISTWMPRHRLQTFLVASDTVPQNTLQMTMFKMCVPPPGRFEAMPVEDAATWLNAKKQGKTMTMVLLESVQDAARLFAAGHPFPTLNIGNIHHAPGRSPVTPAVYLGPDDLKTLADLARRGVRIEIRSLPDEAPVDLSSRLSR